MAEVKESSILIQDVETKNIMTKSTLPVGGYSVNPYVGCTHGCKYCYANKTPQKARENYRYHDPASPLLLGHLRPEDSVTQGAQKSFLAKKALPGQLSL